MLTLLATDAVLLSDGGGKVTAALHPILSGERVASFLLGLMRSLSKRPDFSVELAPVNDQTGFVIRLDGRIDTVVFLQIEHGVIRNLYFVRNPDKLRFIES